MGLSKYSEFLLGDLFYVVSGETTNLYTLSTGDTPFIAATDSNNGVTAYIQEEPTFEKNLITVSRNGSVCEAFFQPLAFCASLDDIRILRPKNFELDYLTGLYICTLIRQEKFRYNYGRKFGTDRIKETKILLPAISKEEVDWNGVRSLSNKYLLKTSQKVKSVFNKTFDTKPISKENILLSTNEWVSFPLSKLFKIKKGKRLTKEDFIPGDTPFIGAIDSNNGYRDFIGQNPIHTGNTITVNYNGSVGESFYQPMPFWASDDVNVLYPIFEMNKYIAFFIMTLIKQEKFRFNYGRKWEMAKMRLHEIKLPSKNGEPDFDYMERYIKSLPYSASI
jgi:hypothetical protein